MISCQTIDLAISSRNFVARQNRKCDTTCSTTLQKSCDSFSNRAVLHSVQLCRENAVNADWSILVHATKLQCATCTVALCNCDVRKSCATKSRDKILQVWHRSYTYLDVHIHAAAMSVVTEIRLPVVRQRRGRLRCRRRERHGCG